MTSESSAGSRTSTEGERGQGRGYAHSRGSLGAMDISTKATRLLELHHTGTTLVLPNVWDAWSARAVAEAGFGALSIGSHPLAD